MDRCVSFPTQFSISSRIFHQLNQNLSLYSQIQTPHLLRSQKTLKNQWQNPTRTKVLELVTTTLIKVSTPPIHKFYKLPTSSEYLNHEESRLSFSRRSCRSILFFLERESAGSGYFSGV